MKLSLRRTSLALAASLALTPVTSGFQPRPPGSGTPPPPQPVTPPPAQPAPTPDPVPTPATPSAPVSPGKPTTPAKPTTPVKPAKPATGQPTPAQPTPAQSVAPQPATPASGRKNEPAIGPYLTLSQPKELVLTARVRVLKGNKEQQISDPFTGQSTRVVTTDPFEPMQSIAMVWPVLPPTASSVTQLDGITGKLLLNDRVATTTFKAMKDYQGGVQYARFDAVADGQPLTPWKVELEVQIPATASRTAFDEKAALAVRWPASWPSVAASWLEPQLFVESGFDENNRIQTYKPDAVKAALEQAAKQAGIADWTKVTPVAAAKIITSFVWGRVQLVTNVASRESRSGEMPPMRLAKDTVFTSNDLGGIVVQPPQFTLETGRGTDYDACALLVAMFRQAGLPARPVIGYDRGGSSNSSMKNDLSSKARRDGRGLRCWVEFALYDEAANTINWIPVDIAKLNKSSSRPMPLDKPWRFFGSNDELNGVVPFAFHFFPPTDVVSYGAPGFWGWFVTPQAPKSAGQAISFSIGAASTRGGQPADTSTREESKPAADDKSKHKDKDERKKRGY